MTRYWLAIDPGTTESAWLWYDTKAEQIEAWGISPNGETVADAMGDAPEALIDGERWSAAIEMVASYGMPVGREVFETCVWIGRFIEQLHIEHAFVYRKDVKLHLCGSPRAKDANVRQALIDMFGPGKDAAIGRKASPGPLYGLKSHGWAALAVAITAAEGAA